MPGTVPAASVNSPQTNEKAAEVQKQEAAAQAPQQVKEPDKIMVDIKGEVKQPGVYESKAGERVIDIVARAGGLTPQADKSQINLAQHVQDEMVIYIPAKGESPRTVPGTGTSESAGTPGSTGTSVTPGSTGTSGTSGNSPGDGSGKITAKVNLNKADAQALETLPGIGPSKAAAILDYRQKNGPFKAIEDLKNISGIGDKTFEKLKDLISVQ